MKYPFLFSLASLESPSSFASAETVVRVLHQNTNVEVLGIWQLAAAEYAANKQGLPDAKLGWFFFPEVQGGKGKANDIFGSVYGWLISQDAPKETLEFIKVLLGKDIQTKLAAEGSFYADG